MITDAAGIMVRKSRLLGVEAGRGGDSRIMEDGGSVEGTSSRWLMQVLL